MQKKTIYYLMAIFVVFIWSITFVSTKVLLQQLSPVEIMFFRYLIAYTALFLLYPKWHKRTSWKEESLFLAAGIFGGTIYFLAENYALQYTNASNVGLLVACSPVLTGLFAHFLSPDEQITKEFLCGCLTAFIGTFLVIFNGHFVLQLHPLGDLLALTTAATFALYCIVVKKIRTTHGTLYATRKIFFYSLLTMLPFLFFCDFRWDIAILFDWSILSSLLFLGLIASCICFVLWSKVIWQLGPIKANNFIYLVPLLTMLFSAIVLHETITFLAILGGVLIVLGVYLAERK